LLVGQPDAAAAAFERAIERKPARTDLLDIFQALGRVYQRAQRTEQALGVWNRLEKLFPDDERVQEQIAATLAEEGQHEPALKRYEVLARASMDPYRQALFHMEAAELKVRLGRTKDALTELEQLYGRLNPDSWLHREVRRKVEQVFLRNDDVNSLTKYYEGWLGKNPEDLDSIARLAHHLAGQGRVQDARTWLTKALKLSPSRKALRLAFIEQLVADQKFAQAIEQYQELDKSEKNNPDYLREWGRLICVSGVG
jgi:tetratricopeptide (TPR) repeat protein